jgi:hypothetical protein
MTISIVIQSANTATVTRTPCWLARWLLGREESTRAVSLGPLHGWFYDDTDVSVDPRVDDAIDRALTLRALAERQARTARR